MQNDTCLPLFSAASAPFLRRLKCTLCAYRSESICWVDSAYRSDDCRRPCDIVRRTDIWNVPAYKYIDIQPYAV